MFQIECRTLVSGSLVSGFKMSLSRLERWPAIRPFARTWTTEMKGRRIRVNSISPGHIDPDFSIPWQQGDGWPRCTTKCPTGEVGNVVASDSDRQRKREIGVDAGSRSGIGPVHNLSLNQSPDHGVSDRFACYVVRVQALDCVDYQRFRPSSIT